MTQMDLFQTAISLPLDTHVSHFHKQGSEEALKMTDISGRTYFPLFKAKDPLGAFSRMFMGMSLWASTKCYLTWKGKATPQGRSLFQLVPRTHLTEETDSGSSVEMWMTPRATEIKEDYHKYQERMREHPNPKNNTKTRPSNLTMQVNTPQFWPTPTTKGYGHASEGQVANLLKKVQDGTITMKEAEQMIGLQTLENHRTYKKMWPTPRVTGQENLDTLIKRKGLKKALQHNLTAAVQMWPTPRARDWKMTGDVANWAESAIGDECLRRAVGRKEATPGSLNPQWVEWLMGYPEGWTDLED